MCLKVFTTGGTIDKVYFDAKSKFQIGDPQIVQILKVANVDYEVQVETLLRKDSLDLTEADRTLIAERVRTEPCKRILITHGTDTMVQTAQALMGIPDKVVVLVGSLTPARFKFTDAEFNIGFALGVLHALTEGVYVAMNGRIFANPNHVHKNLELNRFESL